MKTTLIEKRKKDTLSEMRQSITENSVKTGVSILKICDGTDGASRITWSTNDPDFDTFHRSDVISVIKTGLSPEEAVEMLEFI